MIYKYNIEDEKWYPANLKAEFNSTDFPRDLANADLPEGFAYCHQSSPPSCGKYETAVQIDPVMVNGKLIQQWTIMQRTVSDITASKLVEIRAERKRIEALSVEVDGIVYDMDSTARTKYVETMLTFAAMPDLEIQNWKASDNAETGLGNYVTMNKALLTNVWAAGLSQTSNAFAWESDRQKEIDSAVENGDVEALVNVSVVYS